MESALPMTSYDVQMAANGLTSTEAIRLIRDGEKEGWGVGWRYGDGGRGRLSLNTSISLHCHHQNDSCIKTGSDESRFNVSFIVRDEVTRQCPQTTTFFKRERRAEADSNRGPSD